MIGLLDLRKVGSSVLTHREEPAQQRSTPIDGSMRLSRKGRLKFGDIWLKHASKDLQESFQSPVINPAFRQNTSFIHEPSTLKSPTSLSKVPGNQSLCLRESASNVEGFHHAEIPK